MQIDYLIKELVEKINIIARQKSLKETCQLANKHIVELFDLDYAVISLFDFMKREIVSNEEYYYVKPGKDMGRQHPENWITASKYVETSTDIVFQVFRQKRIVKVIGRHVFDNYKSDDDSTADPITFKSLNGDIYKNAQHEKLARFYLPIVHRKLKQGDNIIDFSLGVIEVALKEKFEGQFSTFERDEAEKNFNLVLHEKFPEIRELEHLLQLYTDNFAQSCYYFIVEEEAKRLAFEFTSLRSGSENSPDDEYRRYATDVIKRLTNLLNIEWGIISFKTFENSYINYLDKATFFSNVEMQGYLIPEILENRENIPDDSMVEYVCNISHAPYFSDDVTRPGERYLEAIKFPHPVFSEMVVPIFYEEDLVGVVDLYSVKKGYFNTIIADIVNRAMETFAYFYMAKKRQYAYNVLIRPTGAWNSSEEVYSQLIKLLSDFYHTGNVALWVKNEAFVNELNFNLYKGTEGTSNFLKKYPFKIGETKPINNPGKLREIDVQTEFNETREIFRFCKENGFRYYLSVCIRFNNKPTLLVNVFSKQKVLNDSVRGDQIQQEYLTQQYEFLTQIATKVSMTLQNVKIIESLKSMSDPIAQDLSLELSPVETYRKIVKSAQMATGADIVCLFPYNKQQKEIKRKDVISSDDKIDTRDEKAVFADIIYNDKHNVSGLYFFDTDQEMLDFLDLAPYSDHVSSFQENYRTTNNIKSTCIVRLEFGNKPVGVIFFNYTTEQKLRKNITLQQIILFFSSFAANHIYLNVELEYIRKEIKGLNELHDKVVPLATRSNFFILVEGMSHIIKNAYAGITDDFDFLLLHLTGKPKRIIEEKRQKFEKAIELVEGVLTILKFRDGETKKVYVDIPKIIQATIKFFRISRNSEVEYTFIADEDIPDLLCEEAEFAMIIYNLVYNSLTAISKVDRVKGKIHLEAKCNHDNGNCIITIEDNGIGIKHENDELIYTPEWSTKDKGTGLGLYYIRKTLETYGGTITHKSDSSTYTKFTLTIPIFNKYY